MISKGGKVKSWDIKPDSMTWSTGYIYGFNVLGSIYNRDAVITFKPTKQKHLSLMKDQNSPIYFSLGLPAWITGLMIWTFSERVTWIPSVLGLVPGEVTLILKAWTLTDCSKLTCISWAFCTLRPYTFKSLHWMKDTSCKPKVFDKLLS